MNNNSMLDQAVSRLKLIGPRRAASLERMGVFTLGDLLYHFPREYEDRKNLQPVYKLKHNSQAVVEGVVVGLEEIKPRKNLVITKLGIHDGVTIFYAVWFNQPYVKKQLPPGTKVMVSGKVDRSFAMVQIKANDFDILDGPRNNLNTGRIVALYPLSGNLSQRTMRRAIFNALQEFLPATKEFLPSQVLQKYKFPAIHKALENIHFPVSNADASEARRRFVFEEFFIFQMALAHRRDQNASGIKKHRYRLQNKLTELFTRRLPFNLTPAQKRVWQEIARDMDAVHPMNRLLQGDVGSGKTVVSALALLKAVDSGYQAALMAPTEILAEQHYFNLSRYMHGLGIKMALITGGIDKKGKNSILAGVLAGEVEIVIGTHALIQETVQFSYLSLVIIDEQHRFGVRQRAILQDKGVLPDVLVMTATPIPRTLAMTLYGDLDMSVIDSLPPGRLPVKTLALKPTALHKVYAFMNQEIDRGNQAYVVCALVEESEKIDVQPAIEVAEYLKTKIFPSFKVGLVHGRMQAAEKDETMTLFRQGEIDILVATSVIEVGVDVPGATVMVVLDAQRFGLAQLHQLRGRVGRGDKQSFCFLIAESLTEEGVERLRAMTQSTDGFRLAETDLKIRGPGEFFGTRQSGLPEFKIADPVADVEVMSQARREAVKILSDDPQLEGPENKLLLGEIKRRLNKENNYFNIS